MLKFNMTLDRKAGRDFATAMIESKLIEQGPELDLLNSILSDKSDLAHGNTGDAAHVEESTDDVTEVAGETGSEEAWTPSFTAINKPARSNSRH